MVTTLSIGDLGEVIDATYALPTIIESRLGSVISNAFFVLVIISIFACGLIIMASGSRLIYAMARDDVFPMSDMFSSVSEKSGAPIPAVVLMLGLGLLAELFSESLEQLLLAAAVLPALIYLSTIGAYLKQRDSMPLRFGTFTLGRFGKPIGVMAAGWLLFVIGVLTIPEEFQFTALVSLLLCLSGLIPYYLWAAGKDNEHGNS